MGEKYVTWADPYTGVHPWLPPEEKVLYGERKSSFLQKLLGVPLAMIPFFNILLLLGFINPGMTHCPSKKGNRPPKEAPGNQIHNGHIIISNHVSYVDILALAYWFSPQFTSIPPQGTGLAYQSFFGAFMASITNEIVQAKALSIKEFVEKYGENGPIVIFPEGTTTNGKILIGCQPIFSEYTGLKKEKIHILGLKYVWKSMSPSFTVGKVLLHMFRLCLQTTNNLKGVLILDNDIPHEPLDYPNEWSQQLYTLLSKNALNVDQGQILRDQKIPFLQKYYNQKVKSKKQE